MSCQRLDLTFGDVALGIEALAAEGKPAPGRDRGGQERLGVGEIEHLPDEAEEALGIVFSGRLDVPDLPSLSTGESPTSSSRTRATASS